ncbi:MAG: ribonuclease HI family protein [Coriobacteriia bacterium]|nr:ribonuclease HI family protein [Coriobacteriia bacterium]
MTREALLQADGAARGNPGPAAIGVVLVDESGAEIAAFGRCIGTATNNVAEYQALIAGLQAAQDHNVRSLVVRLDSELLVRQMTGRYRVKSASLKPLHERAAALAASFDAIRFEHVPRSMNARADALCNEALDGAASGDTGCPHPEDAGLRLF